MPEISRKDRRKQQREEQILDVARKMLVRGGYLGLNMDRIAEEIDYSKGTIYQHFPNKEEIIIALAIQTMERRVDMFRRAAAFSGRPRERMAAIGLAVELFVRLYPDHFSVEQIVRASSIWEKTSGRRQAVMRSCETNCMNIVSGIIRDGIAHGDVQLPDGVTPEDVVFGLWSMSSGGYAIISTAAADSLGQLGIRDPFVALRENFAKFLDGFHWRPTSEEYDYAAVYERAEKKVFAEELALLATG